MICPGTLHKCDETPTTLLGVISLQLMSSLDCLKSQISKKKILNEWNAQNKLKWKISIKSFFSLEVPNPLGAVGGFGRLGPIPNFFRISEMGCSPNGTWRQNTLSACGRNMSWEAHWMFVQGGALSLRQLPVKAWWVIIFFSRWAIIFFSMSDNFFLDEW